MPLTRPGVPLPTPTPASVGPSTEVQSGAPLIVPACLGRGPGLALWVCEFSPHPTPRCCPQVGSQGMEGRGCGGEAKQNPFPVGWEGQKCPPSGDPGASDGASGCLPVPLSPGRRKQICPCRLCGPALHRALFMCWGDAQTTHPGSLAPPASLPSCCQGPELSAQHRASGPGCPEFPRGSEWGEETEALPARGWSLGATLASGIQEFAPGVTS